MTAESYMIRNWMAKIGNINVVFQDGTGKYIIGEKSERGERVKRIANFFNRILGMNISRFI
jgi:hypothetical protein